MLKGHGEKNELTFLRTNSISKVLIVCLTLYQRVREKYMYLVISWNLLKPQVKNIKIQSNRKQKKNKQKLSKEANSSLRTSN